MLNPQDWQAVRADQRHLPAGPGVVFALRAEALWHRENGAGPHAAAVARRALSLLRRVPFETALQAYAARVRGPSQRANLARMCRDAWPAWRNAIAALEDTASVKTARPRDK